MGRHAYRIVQEALTIAASRLRVDGTAGDGLTITVANPCGPGDQADDGRAAGLVGMAERAALVGGWLRSDASPDGAYRLTAWLPWA